MRVAALTLLSLAPGLCGLCGATDKLTQEDRIELTRGLTAEYAKVKVLLPRSRKGLDFNSDGTYDKAAWTAEARDSGPAARLGDLVQITRIDIESDRLVLQINGGFKGGRHWYDNVQIQGPMGGATPVGKNSDSNAPGGTSITILFHKPLEPIKTAEVKKMLAPVLDFDQRSATEIYAESLPPEVQQAIKDKHARVGMTRDQVIMAMGRPEHKSRETKDGIEEEDWVFGKPPGRITFVTFNGDKVIRVKDEYAGLGTIAPDPKDLN